MSPNSARTSTGSRDAAVETPLLVTPSPTTNAGPPRRPGVAADEPLPAGHVRLFRIRAGRERCSWKSVFSAPWRRPTVKLEMGTFPLARAPTYHTISCALPPSDRRAAVRYNGKTRPVPEAVGTVLDYLESTIYEAPTPRGEFLEDWLWMDYLCADADVDAATQAARTVAVLQRAEGTVVCLPPAGRSFSPYHFAVDAHERCRKLGTEDELLWKPGGGEPPAVGRRVVDDDLLDGLCELLAQPWFADPRSVAAVARSRLPPRLLYGTVFLSWAKLLSVAGVIGDVVRDQGGVAEVPPDGLAPAWPNSMGSTRLWIARTYALHSREAEGLQVLAAASRRALGEGDVEGLTDRLEDMSRSSQHWTKEKLWFA